MSIVLRAIDWVWNNLCHTRRFRERNRREMAFIDLCSLSQTALYESIKRVCFDPATLRRIYLHEKATPEAAEPGCRCNPLHRRYRRRRLRRHRRYRRIDLQAQVVGVGTGRDFMISVSLQHARLPVWYLEEDPDLDGFRCLLQRRIAQRIEHMHNRRFVVLPDDIALRLFSGRYDMVMG